MEPYLRAGYRIIFSAVTLNCDLDQNPRAGLGVQTWAGEERGLTAQTQSQAFRVSALTC